MAEPRALAAEALGTFFLPATIVGSGVMGEALAAGQPVAALLPHTLAIGAVWLSSSRCSARCRAHTSTRQ